MDYNVAKAEYNIVVLYSGMSSLVGKDMKLDAVSLQLL